MRSLGCLCAVVVLAAGLAGCSEDPPSADGQGTGESGIPWAEMSPGQIALEKAAQADKVGDWPAVLKHADQALSHRLSSKEKCLAYRFQSSAYLALDMPGEARVAAQRAIDMHREDEIAWTNLGVALRRLDRRDEALDAYREALDLNPGYAEAHTSLGALYVQNGWIDRALPHLEKAIKLDPELAVAHANLAVAYQQKGRTADAQTHWAEAKRLGYARSDEPAVFTQPAETRPAG